VKPGGRSSDQIRGVAAATGAGLVAGSLAAGAGLVGAALAGDDRRKGLSFMGQKFAICRRILPVGV
jgi:hypothetical protein